MKTINSLPNTTKGTIDQTAEKSSKSRKGFEHVLSTIQKNSEDLKNHLEVLLIMGVEHQRRYGDADLVAKALTAVATYLPVPKDVRKQAIQNAEDWCADNTPHTYFLRGGEYMPSKKDINWKGKVIELYTPEGKPIDVQPLAFVDEIKAKKREERKGRAAKVRETESVAAINADLLNAYIAGASLEQLADIESLLKARKAELEPAKKNKKQEETAVEMESQVA